MTPKPSYEELEKQVKQLEAESSRLAKVEAELKRSLQFTQALLSALPTPVFFKDAQGRYLGCNQAFTEVMGVSAQQMRGKTVEQLWPSEHAKVYHQKDLELLQHPERQTYQFKIKDKHGQNRPVIVFKNVFYDEHGKVAGLVGGFVDITERQQAREESLKRQRFLESVLYHAPDAIVTMDRDHRIIDWNPGAVNMFGYTPEEAIGAELDNLVAHGEQHAEASQKTGYVLSGQRVEAFESLRYRKDGTPLRVIVAGSPIMVDGELKGVVAVYTNITDRVQAEAALRASEEKFRTLVEESPLGVSLIGKDGRYRYTNPEFQNMFGYAIEDIPTGAVWFRKAFPDKAYRRKVVQTWIADLEQTPVGQSRTRVFTVTCKDGSRKDIQFRPVTMENMDQFVIYEDITAKMKLEWQFQQAQKFEAIGTLAGGVAHDFNNLLMGIHGRTSLIKTDLTPSHPHVEHLQAIEEHVRSAADLTKQLLGFARSGKYEVKPSDINELVIGSATMFGRTKKEIQVHTKTQPQPLVAEVDRRQIEQVLLNIYVNAWQAMPDGGDLYLETRAVELDEAYVSAHQAGPGQYAKVVVTDTGVGMDDDTRQRIFDPFFTTKEKGRGTGLGLASAYGIIKNHGGFINVYSEAGYGATFNIYLPLSQSELAHEAPMEGRLIKGSETILLVDDEELILSVGQAMLEKLGYRAIPAHGGMQAIDVIKKMGNAIDLVILDLIMPGMDGNKTFDHIRELQPQMRVLLSSGYAINGQANAILSKGCNAFIQKPFDITELSEKLRGLLDE